MDLWLTRLAKKNMAGGALLADADRLPFLLEYHSGMLLSQQRCDIVRSLRVAVGRHLLQLKECLQATSAVLLWDGPEPDQLSVYAAVSEHNGILPGPFPAGGGILGVLNRQDEVMLAPVRAHSPAIPYCPTHDRIGSVCARTLFLCSGPVPERLGILCVDRLSETLWTEAERSALTTALEQILHSYSLSNDLLYADFERHSLQQAFNGLQLLNGALDTDSVFQAADKALELIVPADFYAVCLIRDDLFEFVYARGEGAGNLQGEKFRLEDSLVGQVVKYRRALPESGTPVGKTGLGAGMHFAFSYRSLWMVPLYQEEGPVIGVLLVAARRPGQFNRHQQELIQLVAGQVAVKVDLALAHEQINRMTLTDSLTGIPNRRAFEKAFSAMTERALRSGGTFSLLLCDIDHFKRINDRFGHPFGDQVIRQVATQLNAVVRTGDLAARIGGEEFAVLLEDSGAGGAEDVAERLRSRVESTQLVCQGETVCVTISVGVASFPQDSNHQEALFSCADQCLYRAKEGGRNRVVNSLGKST